MCRLDPAPPRKRGRRPAVFEFVATHDETDAYSAYFLGDCYRQQDLVPQAIEWFEKARKRDPALRSAYHALFQSCAGRAAKTKRR